MEQVRRRDGLPLLALLIAAGTVGSCCRCVLCRPGANASTLGSRQWLKQSALSRCTASWRLVGTPLLQAHACWLEKHESWLKEDAGLKELEQVMHTIDEYKSTHG